MADVVSLDDFGRLAGATITPSDWLEITQERVDRFADATNDHQFIHVDPRRAALTPFGGTIAHGYLTLSLLSDLLGKSRPVPEGLAMALNYGSDKVRYLAPVKVGQRIRATGRIAELAEKRPGQWLMKTEVKVEIEGQSTPALIAEILSMFIIATEEEDET